MKLTFPRGFLWGSATASYQVEGGIENNDWAEAARQGKVPACGRGCDHATLYETDFDIIQTLGQNAHRLSLEWSRIEPEEGKFDSEAIEHYKKVLHALERRGITPFVTLWHFTLPLWLSKRGGFADHSAHAAFVRYSTYVMEQLVEEFPKLHIMTVNEPLVFAAKGYIEGTWVPFKRHAWLTLIMVAHNLIHAHNDTYTAIKKIAPQAQVGVSKNNRYFHATNKNPVWEIWAATLGWLWNRYFLNSISNHMDFIGLNYYMHDPKGPRDTTLAKNDMGWDIYPEGLYHVLKELGRYKSPIYITENGIADREDKQRKQFIVDHLIATHRAIQDGVDVRGYFYWSLLDNYEWAEGFKERFGLVEIAYDTLERHIRPSAYAYKEICEQNAIEVDSIPQYEA